jgi:S-DNA-T family DNA segregation ATPase FtsK/SpoIIIE
MATRKRTKKRAPSKKSGPSLAETLLRPGLIGSVLVLLAVFTTLSLVAGSRGTITTTWVAWLRGAFGAGVWAVPVVTGVAGLAMVFAAMDGRPTPQWRRPLGVLLLFLALVVGLSLSLPPDLRRATTLDGGAGGWLGTELANALQRTITQVGAWAAVAFLTFCGLIFLTDRLLLDAFSGAGSWMREQTSRRPQAPLLTGETGPQEPLIFTEPVRPRRGPLAGLRDIFGATRRGQQGEFDPYGQPLGAPALPARSLVQPVAPVAGAPPPPLRGLVQPLPADAPIPGAAPGGAASANPAPPARAAMPPLAAQATSPRTPEILQPRIVGGLQEWRLPTLTDMLSDFERRTDSDDYIRQQGRLIQETLALFGVPADFEGAYKGPSVTQYLIKPGYVEKSTRGEQQRIKVKVAKIAGLSNDLALALAAPSVRIEAPIPGTNYVGVEVPNRESNVVGLKELMESDSFQGVKGRLKIALGEDVKGQAVAADLARMPHLLIAGATGSGKSVCINSIITCLLLTHTPDSLRLLMVDPKMVELSVYNGVPHLLSPVVTEVDKAAGVLYWAVKEMERRYALFSKAGARDVIRFNETLKAKGEKPLPYIVVIVDEMADLMMAAPEEVEKHICRLAQMARATGMHLIIATQRPSVDVITGLIKANFPARIAFAVTSQTDSRVILDIPGAERLLGRGDMLFMAPDAGKLERLQGTWLSDDEINKVVRYWKGVRVLESQPVLWEQGQLPLDGQPGLPMPPMAAPEAREPTATPGVAPAPAPYAAPLEQPLFEQIEALKAVDDRDVLFDDAVRAVQEAGKGSVSLLQKKLRIGYSRAARLVEQLEEAGVLGPDQGGTAGRPLTGRAAAAPVASAPSPQARMESGAPSPSGGVPSPAMPSAGSSLQVRSGSMPPPRIIGGEPSDEPTQPGVSAGPASSATPPLSEMRPAAAPKALPAKARTEPKADVWM